MVKYNELGQKFNNRGKRICDGIKCKKNRQVKLYDSKLYCSFHANTPDIIKPTIREMRKINETKCAFNLCRNKKIHLSTCCDVHKCFQCLNAGEYENAWSILACEIHFIGNICNYKKCKEYINLVLKHKAWWCQKHIEEIDNIRYGIKETDDEIKFRLKELQIRKDADNNHIYYYLKLKSLEIKNKRE